MRIDVNEVKRLKERLREINALSLDQIEWYDGDTKVEVPPNWVEDWRFTGLNNADFIDTGAYLEGVWTPNDTGTEGEKL